MRAVVCRELGPPSALVVETVADPVPGPGQVLVKVAASGVNFVDGLFVQGRYQIKPPVPFIAGSEVAGTVAAVGPDAPFGAPRVGDRVVAIAGLGGFAELVAVAAEAVAVLPADLTMTQGATFTQSYCTAWFALVRRAALRRGESVLVYGAGGGVGLAALDTARAVGAVGIAVASSEAKREAARAAGAAHTIDPGTETVKARARELAGGTGVDVVFDPVGGALAEPGLRALGDGGRYLVVGFASGTIPSLALNQILLRNRAVLGVDWGAWAMANPGEHQALFDEVLGQAATGRLRPPEPTRYPLEQAAQALEDLLERRALGKLALVP